MPIQVPEKKKLGEILVERGVLTEETLAKALDGQALSLLPLASTALTMELASEQDLTRGLAEQFGVPGVCLSESVIDTEVFGIMPAEVAAAHHVLPVAQRGHAMLVVFAHPGEKALVDEIAFASGRSIMPHVAPRVMIDRVVRAAFEAKANGVERWVGPKAKAAEDLHLATIDVPRTERPKPLEVEKSEELVIKPKPVPAARSGEKPLVLAVDDEADILDIVDKALTHKGMEVVRAMRGREALEKLQAHHPDIVLLDAMLPEIHGFEICQKIKQSQQFRDVPVIIISAIYTGWNFIHDVKRIYGADDYMAKPFRVMELVRKVEETLAKRKVRPPSPEVAAAHRQVDVLIKQATDAMRSGQTEDAVAQAQKAVDADPFDPRAHFICGMALHKAGRLYEAISVYERVVELAPGQFAALKNLAVLYERQSFKAKAVEMWMRALEASPSDAVRQTIKAHLIDLL